MLSIESGHKLLLTCFGIVALVFFFSLSFQLNGAKAGAGAKLLDVFV